MTETAHEPTEMIYRARRPAPVQTAALAFYEVHTEDVPRLTHYYEDSLGLICTERDSETAYLTTASDHHNPPPSRGGRAGGRARPTKLGHVASYVEDLASSQRFYLEVMGFRFSDMIGDFFTFLRCNSDHHAVNLMESSTRVRTGLFHVAFEMRDFMHLKDQLDHLSTRGHALIWGPGRHGVGHNIFTYHRDPDGNIVELFTEIDLIFDEVDEHFEPRPWHEEFPQRPKVWDPAPGAANTWGIIEPLMMEH